MEKNLEFLIECMDDLSMEQQKVRQSPTSYLGHSELLVIQSKSVFYRTSIRRLLIYDRPHVKLKLTEN